MLHVITCVCVLQAPCCGKLYVCRLCHDAEENHQMDRFKVKEVQCSECQTLQQVTEISHFPFHVITDVRKKMYINVK